MIENPSNWFERLTGVRETSPEAVREQLEVRGDRIHSLANGQSWAHGTLETPTLAELRERVAALGPGTGRLRLRQQVANVQDLHADPANANALFQVASQFNLLEMVSERINPEQGIGRYEGDRTQGPACAIAAGSGTIYRNYFVDVDGQVGQTENNQIDCLRDLAVALENDKHQHWVMKNGYALPTHKGLEQIVQALKQRTEEELDQLRELLRIGLHWQTEVTLDGCSHLVSQAYCSAMPVSYSQYSPKAWEPFAKLILEAAYEATFCAAILSASSTGDNRLFLTRLGGGAFGNRAEWIVEALCRAMRQYGNHNLEVTMISYRYPQSDMDTLTRQHPW